MVETGNGKPQMANTSERRHKNLRASEATFYGSGTRKTGILDSQTSIPVPHITYSLTPLKISTKSERSALPEKSIKTAIERDSISVNIVELQTQWNDNTDAPIHSIQGYLAEQVNCLSYNATRSRESEIRFTWLTFNTDTIELSQFAQWAAHHIQVTKFTDANWHNFERITPDGTVILTDNTQIETPLNLDHYRIL